MFPFLEQWEDLTCHEQPNNVALLRDSSSIGCSSSSGGGGNGTVESGGIFKDEEVESLVEKGFADVDGDDDDQDREDEVVVEDDEIEAEAEEEAGTTAVVKEEVAVAAAVQGSSSSATMKERIEERAIVRKFLDLFRRELENYGDDSLSRENKFALYPSVFYVKK